MAKYVYGKKPTTVYSVGKKNFRLKSKAISYAKKTGASKVKRTSYVKG